ncbi:hypothetical protein P879_08640 [Paragonimus westermani]|uniref:Uncharacterized protein n=1 Tax=Paragonimus westermani TaxID=34504 RepID=A0A8T0D016_9TREM|nr:hypothetical protein P879_08640 [Paragonimus westermani]
MMARLVGENDETYDGFLAPDQTPQRNLTNMYHTTDSRCKRYFCAVCRDCHSVDTDCTQRITEWLTGTTMSDALHRSLEANMIDDYTLTRFKQVRQVDNTARTFGYKENESRKKEASALTLC